MQVLMPQLGETVAEGKVATWHKRVGERVEADELLFEVETDKVVTDIPAPVGGVITAILVEADEVVDVGTPIAVIDDGSGAEDAPAATPKATSAPAAAGGSAAPAAAASAGDADPPLSPAVRRLVAEHGIDPRELPATGRRGRITRADVIDYLARRDARPPARAAAGRPPLSPVVRRLAAEHGLDLAALAGTGRDGRITRRDVLAHLDARGVRAPGEAGGDVEVIPFNARRRVTAEHMVRSKATSPHVLQAVEADYSAVERARRAHGAAWRAEYGYTLTYLPFIAYAVCRAIADFPRVNARVDGERLVVSKAVHLGIAVDLDFDGLVAPVIRDAQRLSVAGLAAAIRRLSVAARANRLGPDDYAGGTYTISNAGSFDTLFTAPIIHQPQVAILSTDGVRKRAVVIEGPDGDALAIRPVGILAQSFDHRAIDGAYSAAFLRRLRERLEGSDWAAALAAERPGRGEGR